MPNGWVANDYTPNPLSETGAVGWVEDVPIANEALGGTLEAGDDNGGTANASQPTA